MTDAPLSPLDCYHTGLVVPDLQAAIESTTAAAGYTWTKAVEATLAIAAGDAEYEVPFKFVYSIEAPHLELIQAVPGTIWAEQPGGAAHHLGYWADDLVGIADRLAAAGYRLEARPAGDQLSMFAYFIAPSGVRIEIVDRALFPDFPGFLESVKA
ncbi:VOC family protein [Mycobacterium vicinigordonae]|uniref:VOC family protein n=1 Tax=Mycobacterium vicinigordonae TaxID=1719132 RepID=A0A7D6E020_9MYCO|nr:VOC family protein [Mycobacterium vicinigordonae]QLL08588.1 VOC family protein [Mycobacterium vicinigordonae]